ncbi:helix-turn-helix domain-containing protein [Cohnella herbarum]|uniref:AraC family transcriptional regulator n=1 Tax=Cohnella herbarum TaxID=2728023 RepID=A0A7Z2VPT3_9BACL|nr:helix-turn-helix domain-containing protein [Cohnella herbarum]QJD86953.1 AraC family transcriptional regulator [Cohnella herbarum]
MRVLQAYKSRKYLQRILLTISILMVFVLILSSMVLHYSTETRVVQMQKEANRKVMNQINHNISYMQEIVRNQALTIYNDNQIFFTLMSSQEQEEIDIINGIRLMNKAQESSAFLHSVMIYNGHMDKIYALGFLAENLKDHYMAENIAKQLQNKQKLPQMQLIPMNLSKRENSVDFFSMIIYESFNDINDHESALVVNVKPEWIFANLKAVNDFAIPGESDVFIMDRNGQVVLSGNERNVPELNGLTEALAAYQAKHEGKFGSFSESFGSSGKYMVSYMQMGVGGWNAISVQPYHAVLGGIYEMRMTSIYVIVCFLLLSIALSILIAHKLYKPVEQMLAGIRNHAGEGADPVNRSKDELSYVTNVYSLMAQKLSLVTNEQDKQRNIVHNYHLRSIITGSSSYTKDHFRDCVTQNGLAIVPDGFIWLVLIKIDQYAEFVSRTSDNERKLYSFAISNIAEEIMSPSPFRSEIADMRNDHLVMIVSREAGTATSFEEVESLLTRIQDIVKGYYKLSLTMTTSELIRGHEAITVQYGLAIQHSMYRLVFGKGQMITPERVKPNNERFEYSFPPEQEKKLSEAIRTNDLEAMESLVSIIITQVSAYHYDHILHGILQLVDIVKTTIRDMNKLRVASVSVDLSALSRQVLEKETLGEIEQLIHQVCREIHEKLQNSEQDKNTVLMDAIKEIVATNYGDMNLSLQGIASMLRMTPAYVGRMFKQSEIVSVGEYINEVRLSRALEYLETKNFSIKEIMELVGYLNESTFFKLFKKKYGVTPKEYRLKRNIS